MKPLDNKKKKKRFKNIPPTEPPARNVKNVSATRLQYPWKSSEISPIRRQTEPQRPSKQTIAPRSAMQTRRKIKYRREANHYRVNVSNLLTILSLCPTRRSTERNRIFSGFPYCPSIYTENARARPPPLQDEIAGEVVQLAMVGNSTNITENVVTGRLCSDCYCRAADYRAATIAEMKRGMHGRPREINSFERFHPGGLDSTRGRTLSHGAGA